MKIIKITFFLLAIHSFGQVENIELEIQNWNSAGFANTEISNLDTSKWYKDLELIEFTHYIDLTVVILRNSKWDLTMVNTALKKVAEIFGSQCNIHIRTTKVIIADSPSDDFDTYVKNRIFKINAKRKFNGLEPLSRTMLDREFENENSKELERMARIVPTSNRPIVFLVGDYFENTVFGDVGGFALWPGETEYLNMTYYSVFIKYGVNDESYIIQRRNGYSVIAHELTHLLCRCKHSDSLESSIMAGNIRVRTNKIPSVLCEQMKIKKSPFLYEY